MVADLFVQALRPLAFRGKPRLLNLFIPHQGERIVTAHGCQFRLDLGEYIQRSVYFGTFEAEEARVVARLLKPGQTFVDAGANIGYFTALAASRVGPAGRILSVEPSTMAFLKLERLIRDNHLNQVILHHGALGDTPGESPLYLDESRRDNHNFSPSLVPQGDRFTLETVPVTTLDALAEKHALDRIDLLKIDVEGHEPHVLAGAARLIHQQRIRSVFCEVDEYNLHAAGSSAERLLKQFDALGFRVTQRVSNNYFFQIA